jgi:hypothetical protein
MTCLSRSDLIVSDDQRFLAQCEVGRRQNRAKGVSPDGLSGSTPAESQ